MTTTKTWLVGIFSKSGVVSSTTHPFTNGTRTLPGQWFHEFENKRTAEEFCIEHAKKNHHQVAKLFATVSSFAAEDPRIQQTVFD